MKKIFTLVCSLFVAMAVMAAVETMPIYYQQNFKVLCDENDELPAEWITIGGQEAPASAVQPYFLDGNRIRSFVLMNIYNNYVPMCNTNFEDEDVAADTWLITPEFEIPNEYAELSWTVVVYNANGALGVAENTYEILVNDQGTTDLEDFTSLFTGKPKGNTTAEYRAINSLCRFNNYNGKKLRLAFHFTGREAGMIGITNIKIGNYAVSVDNKTPNFVNAGEQAIVKLNLGLKAPIDCPSVVCNLQVNGEEHAEITYTKAFGRESGTTLIYQIVDFKDYPITAGTDPIKYKLTITPQFAESEATPGIIEGVIAVPQVTYLNNVVMEEPTATGCGYCPSGTASIEYLMENYPGTETVGRVIPIAVHAYMNYDDPMNEGVYETYAHTLMLFNESTGLPQACFNRATRGKYPWDISYPETMLTQKSNNFAQLNSVKYDGDELTYGSKITANFDVKCGYESSEAGLSAAIVLVENDVKGYESGYDQANNFYNWTTADMASSYGEWIVPYLSKYIGQGASIKASKMTYQHVARGIFPAFEGTPINADYKVDTPENFSISFEMPDYVLEPTNTEVVLMVMNSSQEIVASDTMSYAEFSGVQDILNGTDALACKAWRDGKSLMVNAPAGANVEVYNLQGVKVASYKSVGAEKALNVDGIAVVRIVANGTAKTIKVM